MTATMTSSRPEPLTPSTEQIAQYHREGWFLMPSALNPAQLELLRGGCQRSIAAIEAEMDRQRTDVIGINHRGRRYFSAQPSLTQPWLYDVIYAPVMAGICRALLGDDVRVFWEQYVVKAAEGGHEFAWHQDSAYVDHDHRPYLTCWVALDDMSEANGTISVLPFSRAPSRGRLPHRQDPRLNDLVGYDGSDPGVLVECPAGSIACFTSVTLHRSGANRTPRQRRVYLIQYSAGEILRPDGTPWGRSERFLAGGRLVGEGRSEACGR